MLKRKGLLMLPCIVPLLTALKVVALVPFVFYPLKSSSTNFLVIYMYGFSGSFFNLLARSSCFKESKALLKSIEKRQLLYSPGYPLRQVAVDPMLN